MAVIVEGDALEVIDALKAFPRRTNWRIHNAIMEIYGLFRQLEYWKRQHTKRGSNMSRCLSRWATSEFNLGTLLV